MSGRPAKPLFLTTKGQRSEQDGGLDLWHLEDHYRDVHAGRYKWRGGPADMPPTFIEDSLFYSSGIGAKRTKGFGAVVTPCEPSTITLYGQPYTWLPSPLHGTTKIMDSDFFSESDGPCLWLKHSMISLIQPYLDIMSNALMTLNTNIDGLNQPIVIKGVPGAELGSMVWEDKLRSKSRYIPATSAGVSMEVLDLKAQDHTQNLISVIDWCDARILETMASSNGVEKASGITTMETVSGVQSVMQDLQVGLEMRRAWADRVNDKLGLGLSVELGEGVTSLTQSGPKEESDVRDDS